MGPLVSSRIRLEGLRGCRSTETSMRQKIGRHTCFESSEGVFFTGGWDVEMRNRLPLPSRDTVTTRSWSTH